MDLSIIHPNDSPNPKITLKPKESELMHDKQVKPEIVSPKDDKETILIITFKLPIHIERDRSGQLQVKQSKSILFNTLLNLQQKNTGLKTVWIGFPGIIPKND